MVTANNARFKDRSIMSESYVERYIRAKKRHAVAPKCLFGAPRRTETDQFLLQHDVEQTKETKEVFEKYDLSEISDGDEKDDIFPPFETSVEPKNEVAETSLKFQAKIVTEHDPPPSDNLFSPIEKVEASTAAGSDKATDYWQTSKRRRSSSNLESEEHRERSETPKDDDPRNVKNPDNAE